MAQGFGVPEAIFVGNDAVAGTIYVDRIQQVQFFQSIWQAEQAELWVSRMSTTHEHPVAYCTRTLRKSLGPLGLWKSTGCVHEKFLPGHT